MQGDYIWPINREENNRKLDVVPMYGCPGDVKLPEDLYASTNGINTTEGEGLTIGAGDCRGNTVGTKPINRDPTGALACSPLPRLSEINCLDFLAKVSNYCDDGDFPSMEEQLEEIDECECDVNKLRKWKRIAPYVEKMEARERLERAGIINKNGELAEPYRDEAETDEDTERRASELQKRHVAATYGECRATMTTKEKLVLLVTASNAIREAYGRFSCEYDENDHTVKLLDGCSKAIANLIDVMLDELKNKDE